MKSSFRQNSLRSSCNFCQICTNSLHDFSSPYPKTHRDTNTPIEEDPNIRRGCHKDISSCRHNPQAYNRTDRIAHIISTMNKWSKSGCEDLSKGKNLDLFRSITGLMIRVDLIEKKEHKDYSVWFYCVEGEK